MIIMGSVRIQDLARAINEKRYLQPEEITSDKIIAIDNDADPRDNADD